MERTKQKKNNGVVVRNKDQIQSYIMTTAKYDFNVYEKRILYRLIELAQCELQGLKFPEDCRKVEHTLWGNLIVTLPVTSILSNEDDNNYAKAKKALIALSQKYFEYEDEKTWEKINIIVLPKIQKYKSTFTFQIDPRIWSCCLDFTKGFRKYELVTAMNFKSVYTMRFYELMSGQKAKMSFSLNHLKEMFQVTDKYKLTADFIRKVIEPAKKELDDCSPYTFEWTPQKEGKKIVGFCFYPIVQPQFRDNDLYRQEIQKQTNLSWDLNRQVLGYLKLSLGFSDKEIKNNRAVFIAAQFELPDILGELAILKGKSRDKGNPKGYIINALKGKLKDKQG